MYVLRFFHTVLTRIDEDHEVRKEQEGKRKRKWEIK